MDVRVYGALVLACAGGWMCPLDGPSSQESTRSPREDTTSSPAPIVQDAAPPFARAPALPRFVEPTHDPIVAPLFDLPANVVPAVQRKATIDLTFVGDIIFGRYRDVIYDPITSRGHQPLALVHDQLAADLVFGNLETPMVEELPHESPIVGKFRFGARAADAIHLQRAGFSALSLANNHALDLKLDGLRQTPEILRAYGLVPLGTATAEPPHVRIETLEVSGWSIGVIAVTSRTNMTPRGEGFAIPFVPTHRFAEEVAPLLRADALAHDVRIVYVHWGEEYADVPTEQQVEAAHALVDAGADLVVGHHPHVLQAVEIYGEGVIAYSLGNFLFENAREVPRQTGVLRVRLREAGRERTTSASPSGARRRACREAVIFHPMVIRSHPEAHPRPATGAMFRMVAERLVNVSAPMRSQWLDHEPLLRLQDPLRCGRPPAATVPSPTRAEP